MAGNPLRKGTIPITFAEHWNEFVVASRHQSLCDHQVLLVTDTSLSSVSTSLVFRRADQQNEVARLDRLFHETRNALSKAEAPLVDYNLNAVGLQPESEL